MSSPILWGIIALMAGVITVYLTRRYWLEVADWSVGRWLVALVSAGAAAFGFAVTIAALGPIGIPAAFGVGMLLGSLPVVLYRNGEISNRQWRRLGSGVLQRHPRLQRRASSGVLGWLTRVFRTEDEKHEGPN